MVEAFERELLASITQEPPFRFLDAAVSIDETTFVGTVRFQLGDYRCTASRLDSWLCVEMLAQAAEVHTRWLTKARRANGLLVGVDDLDFRPHLAPEQGELVLTVRRGEQVGTFLQYAGEVSFQGVIVAAGGLTIYNVGHD